MTSISHLENIPSAAKAWKLKVLLLCHILAALLLTSLFWPVTKPYWEIVDIAFFKMVNSTLKGNPTWQLFWACANHRLADWVEDFCFLCFFIAYMFQGHRSLRTRKVINSLFCVLCGGAIIYFANSLLFRHHLSITRLSPTRIVEGSIKLSNEIPWMSIKDGSSKSFPGDHGTTALLFAFSFCYIARWRLGLLAGLYTVFLCMPRLITGAHWLSDIVVGSGSIALVGLSWAFCSPLYTTFTEGCEKAFRWTAAKFKSKKLSRIPK